VKIINIKWLLALPTFVLTAGAAFALMAGLAMAQDFTAGKTPAQLFSSDCSTCHHLPNGLGKKYDTATLGSFLREHYTTKPDTAGALAKYVMGFATLRAAPITTPSGDEGGVARSAEDPRTRRRTSNLSGDGEKPKRPRPPSNPQSREEPPMSPAAIAPPSAATEAAVQPPAALRNARPAQGASSDGESSPPVAKLNDDARSGAPVVPHEDPISRIRAYATSGAGPQEAAAEAPKPASGKPHRRSDSGAQPVEAAPAVNVTPPVPAAPAAPANPNAMPPPAPLSAVTPAPAAMLPPAV
jgi:hypothetical protein